MFPGQPHQKLLSKTISSFSIKICKPTIILSWLVYYFKTTRYSMIVTILHYYSSIITIIVKNDNILYVNYTIKTETVRE